MLGPVSRAFHHGALVAAAVGAAVVALLVALLVAMSRRRWRRLRAPGATGRSVRRAAARDLLGAAAVRALLTLGRGAAARSR